MAKAVQALQAKQVNRIILTRPAVEAGERLGFLPGTLNEKIDPYLRPLYDALHDMVDPESIPRLMAAGTIEVAPLAYMRGRAQPVDAGADAGRLPADRRACGSVTWWSGRTACRRRCSASTRRAARTVFRVTTQDGASTLALRRAPVDRHDPGGQAPRAGRRGRCETQDMIGQLRRGHVRRFELPLVGAGRVRAAGRPDRPVRPGAAPRRRLPHRDHDAQLRDGRTRSWPKRSEAALAGHRAAAQGRRTTTSCATSTAAAAGLRIANPVTAVAARARAGRDPVVDEVRARASTWSTSAEVRLAVLQGLLDTDGGPVTQARPHLPRPVHDLARRGCATT